MNLFVNYFRFHAHNGCIDIGVFVDCSVKYEDYALVNKSRSFYHRLEAVASSERFHQANVRRVCKHVHCHYKDVLQLFIATKR